MAPDLNKKLEDEVEKYRQTQAGKSMRSVRSFSFCLFVSKNRHEKVCHSTTTIICNEN